MSTTDNKQIFKKPIIEHFFLKTFWFLVPFNLLFLTIDSMIMTTAWIDLIFLLIFFSIVNRWFILVLVALGVILAGIFAGPQLILMALVLLVQFPVILASVTVFFYFLKSLREISKTELWGKILFLKNSKQALISSWILFVVFTTGMIFYFPNITCSSGWIFCNEFIFQPFYSEKTSFLNKYREKWSQDYAKRTYRNHTEYSQVEKTFLPNEIGKLNGENIFISSFKQAGGNKDSDFYILEYIYENNSDYITNVTNIKYDSYLEDTDGKKYKQEYIYTLNTRETTMFRFLPGQKTISQISFKLPKNVTSQKLFISGKYKNTFVFDLSKSVVVQNSIPNELKTFKNLPKNKIYTLNETMSTDLFDYTIVEESMIKDEFTQKDVIKLVLRLKNRTNYDLPKPLGKGDILTVTDNFGDAYRYFEGFELVKDDYKQYQKAYPAKESKDLFLKIPITPLVDNKQNLPEYEINYQVYPDTDIFIYRTGNSGISKPSSSASSL